MIKIETITPDLAEGLCRKITVDLPEYFGLPEVNEHYVQIVVVCGAADLPKRKFLSEQNLQVASEWFLGRVC